MALPMNRRIFVKTAAAAALATSYRARAADDASKKLRVAVVALGRGMGHVNALLKLPNVEIAYLAEADPKRLANGMKAVANQETPCQGEIGDLDIWQLQQ